MNTSEPTTVSPKNRTAAYARHPLPSTLASRVLLLLTTLLLTRATSAADPAPPISDFDGPPIEHDTLKKAPDARYKKMFKDDGTFGHDTMDTLNNLDGFRKTFWETYPDKKYHEEAREAFAQALFLKDVHYLRGVLYLRQMGGAVSPAFTPDPKGEPKDITHAVIMAGGVAALQFDAVGAVDDGIPETLTPEFSDWFNAMYHALGPLTRRSGGDDAFKAGAQMGFGLAGADFRKACDFGGKEYQAYLIERDWAEFDKANMIPAGYDTPQKYGIYLYARQAKLPLDHAQATYADMVSLLGRSNVEAAVDSVRTAPKTPEKQLISKYPPPVKHSPGGGEIPDYDVPMPKDITGFFTNQLIAMEALATQSATADANAGPHAYLLSLLKSRYSINQQHNLLDPKATKWSFAETTYRALCNAFGKKQVLDLAEKIRTAPKRQYHMTIMDPESLGATRNDPIEAFEDILARSDPKGYVKAALAFNENINNPGSIDVEAAYKKLIATTDEKALLEAAKQCAAGDRRLASANAHFAFRDELVKIREKLATPTVQASPATFLDDPDYLAWKKFPDNVTVSYILRGWKTDPRHPEIFTGPSDPTIRYTLSVKSRTPELIVLWDTETVYDYPSGKASPPRDTEIGYPAKRALPTAAQAVRLKGGTSPAATAAPVAAPNSDSGDETLTLAGRAILTHWTSTTRTSGKQTSIIKIWSSDDIPGTLVRKTEETIIAPAANYVGLHQLRETVLESFQGFPLGTPAVAGAAAPAAPTAPANLAAQPAPVPAPLAPVAPTKPPATPTTPTTPPAPAPPPTARQTPANRTPSPQQQALQRYTLVRARTIQDTSVLGTQQKNLPPDIADAKANIDLESTAAATAIRAKNYDEANKQLQSAEDNLELIEKYLKP